MIYPQALKFINKRVFAVLRDKEVDYGTLTEVHEQYNYLTEVNEHYGIVHTDSGENLKLKLCYIFPYKLVENKSKRPRL